MCGIVGQLCFSHTGRQVEIESLIRMRDTMHHRGPDAEGIWVDPESTIGLGHRRLSIIDLSDRATQPLSNEHEDVWIVFNGEIYNYRDLRRALEGRHCFRSDSDTEVIVHLYEDLGAEFVKRLNGMFALAIWDRRKKLLLLARDRLGIKPLYFQIGHGDFTFASEIKALLANPCAERKVDVESLYQYLTFKVAPAPRTLFTGVRKLGPGAMLTIDLNGTLESTTYWDAAPRSHCVKDRDTASKKVLQLLEQSVARQMIADVPVGVFLSGGLDSTAILGLAARQTRSSIKAFSINVREAPELDEQRFSRLAAATFGAEHIAIECGIEEVIEAIPKLVRDQDEPLGDTVSIPLHFLSRLATSHGIKVVLTGEGADELFLGYESRLEFLNHFDRTYKRLLAFPNVTIVALLMALRAVGKCNRRLARIGESLARIRRGDEMFWGSVAFTERELAALTMPSELTDGFMSSQELLNEIAQPLRQSFPDAPIETHVSYVDIKLRLAELLLMRVDKVTMSSSLEARVPFLDHELVEYVMGVSPSVNRSQYDAKPLLKAAVRSFVPSEILKREKQPFASPFGIWLRRGLEEFARPAVMDSKLRNVGLFRYDIIEQMFNDHASGKRDHGVRLWALVNLSAWYDEWF